MKRFLMANGKMNAAEADLTGRWVLRRAVALMVLLAAWSAPALLRAQQNAIAYVGPDPQAPTNTVLNLINPDGSGNGQVNVQLVNPQNPSWSRDGQLIAGQGAPIGVPAFDIYTFDRTGANLQPITNLGLTGLSQLFSAFSADTDPGNQRLAVSFADTSVPGQVALALQVYFRDGTPGPLVGAGVSSPYDFTLWGVDWSPVADLLVTPLGTVKVCPPGSPIPFVDAVEIWSVPPVDGGFDKGLGKEITSTGAALCANPTTLIYDVLPAFSPDGARVAFVRWIEPNFGATINTFIRVINLDGRNERQVVAFANEETVGVSWSGDGTQLVFDRGEVIFGIPNPGSKGLWVINVDGSGLRQVTPADTVAYTPSWSWATPTSITETRGR